MFMCVCVRVCTCDFVWGLNQGTASILPVYFSALRVSGIGRREGGGGGREGEREGGQRREGGVRDGGFFFLRRRCQAPPAL